MSRTNTADTKVCAGCGKAKPLSKFSQDARAKDGHRPQCKKCSREYQHRYYAANKKKRQAEARAYYAANKKKRTAYARAYRAANREKLRAGQADARLRCKYGITLAEYDTMLKAQGNGCAICGRTPEENGKRLCVDHDHETGAVRGLLCHTCNQALGLLYDSSVLLHRAANYVDATRAVAALAKFWQEE